MTILKRLNLKCLTGIWISLCWAIMFGKWFLAESLIHFSRNSFIPGKCLLLNVTFILPTELQSDKRNSLDWLYYMQLLSNLTIHLFWLYYLFPNSINEHCELYFHTQWPLGYNDVTEPLWLLQFCLFMPLFCFCYPNLLMFTLLMCYLHFLVEPLALLTFLWQENKFNTYDRYFPAIKRA